MKRCFPRIGFRSVKIPISAERRQLLFMRKNKPLFKGFNPLKSFIQILTESRQSPIQACELSDQVYNGIPRNIPFICRANELSGLLQNSGGG